MQSDERSYRVALVADELVNGRRRFDTLAALQRAGWGVMLLPPAWYSDDVAAGLLEQIAEHVEEFVRHRYDVILVGARAGLEEALSAMGLGPPDAVAPVTRAQLNAFLAARR